MKVSVVFYSLIADALDKLAAQGCVDDQRCVVWIGADAETLVGEQLRTVTTINGAPITYRPLQPDPQRPHRSLVVAVHASAADGSGELLNRWNEADARAIVNSYLVEIPDA